MTPPPTAPPGSYLDPGAGGRQLDSDGTRISASYIDGALTWTEHRTRQPAGPPASEPSWQGQQVSFKPKRPIKRPLARLVGTHPGQLEALMFVVVMVIGSSVLGLVQYLHRPMHENTVPVGVTPNAVAVDPDSHAVYVTSSGDHTVTVIDGLTHSVTATVPLYNTAGGVAVDPGTHTVYVANYGHPTVSVIDGSTHTVIASVPVGNNPFGVAVDPDTHTAYVSNFADSTVSVIDGTTDTVTSTLPVGNNPDAVAVNPDTHTIYVTNYAEHSVSVIKAPSGIH